MRDQRNERTGRERPPAHARDDRNGDERAERRAVDVQRADAAGIVLAEAEAVTRPATSAAMMLT